MRAVELLIDVSLGVKVVQSAHHAIRLLHSEPDPLKVGARDCDFVLTHCAPGAEYGDEQSECKHAPTVGQTFHKYERLRR